VHRFRCYDNSAEREMSASACTRSMPGYTCDYRTCMHGKIMGTRLSFQAATRMGIKLLKINGMGISLGYLMGV